MSRPVNRPDDAACRRADQDLHLERAHDARRCDHPELCRSAGDLEVVADVDDPAGHPRGVHYRRIRSQETVIMGPIRKRESQAKAAQAPTARMAASDR